MARIIGVHGVGKQRLGGNTLLNDWEPALADGLDRVGGDARLTPGDLRMAFYGDLFRPPGRTLAVGDPVFTPDDVDEGFETELLLEWWAECARTDPAVPPPGATDTPARAPRAVQTALRVLQYSRFFADVSLRALVFDLKQTRSGSGSCPAARASADRFPDTPGRSEPWISAR